jgi:hypothetical protein
MILLTYRPGRDDAHDPEVAQALALAERDPSLKHWLDRHLASQSLIRESLRQISVPPGLRERILSNAPAGRPSRRLLPGLLLPLAAALVLMIGLAALWIKSRPADAFPTFRDRMVRKVLREYTMDIVTTNGVQIRQYLATNSAPADYILPQGLERLPALGAGLQSWQGQRVSMVCLDGGGQGTLFLFVVDTASVKSPPGSTPEFAPVSKLATASWTTRGRTYVLAGTSGSPALRQNF